MVCCATLPQVRLSSSSCWMTSCFEPLVSSSTAPTLHLLQPPVTTSTPSKCLIWLFLLQLFIRICFRRQSTECFWIEVAVEINKSFRCSTASSRLAAYEVLVMLTDSSLSNLRLITRELLSMHHQSDPSLSKEFDVGHFSDLYIRFSFVMFLKKFLCLLSVFTACGEPLGLRFRRAEERWSHLLYERCVPAALYAAWPSWGTQISNVLLQKTCCLGKDLDSNGDCDFFNFVLGFPIDWGWHRPAWRECFLPSSVFVWPLDGEQTAILCARELLEGKRLFTWKFRSSWRVFCFCTCHCRSQVFQIKIFCNIRKYHLMFLYTVLSHLTRVFGTTTPTWW